MLEIIGDIMVLCFILVNITNDLATYGTKRGIVRCLVKSIGIIGIYNIIIRM